MICPRACGSSALSTNCWFNSHTGWATHLDVVKHKLKIKVRYSLNQLQRTVKKCRAPS